MAGRNFYRYASGRNRSPRAYLFFGGTTVINITGFTPDETANQTIVINTSADAASDDGTRHIFGMSGASDFMLGRRGLDATPDVQMRMFSSTTQNITPLTWAKEVAIEFDVNWLGNGGAVAVDKDPGGYEIGTSGTDTPSGSFQIGDRSGGSNWLGHIWDVSVYNGSSSSGTLIHKWAIDDNNGTTILDSVGNANGALTIGNGSWGYSKPPGL